MTDKPVEFWRAEIVAVDIDAEANTADVWVQSSAGTQRVHTFPVAAVVGAHVGGWLIAIADDTDKLGVFCLADQDLRQTSNGVWRELEQSKRREEMAKFFVRHETVPGSFIVPDEPAFDPHERANEQMAALSARFIVGADDFYFKIPQGGDFDVAVGDDGLVRKWRQLYHGSRPLRDDQFLTGFVGTNIERWSKDNTPPCRIVWTEDGYSKLEPVLLVADAKAAAPTPERCQYNGIVFEPPVFVADLDQEPPGWTSSDIAQDDDDRHNFADARHAHGVALCEAERSRILLTSRELPWCPHAMRQVELVRWGAALYWHCEHCHGRRAP